jgi:hypothetical protein
LVEKIYNSTLIPNYKTKVRAIYHCEENLYKEEIQLNLSEAIKEYLSENNMEINEENIKFAKSYILENNIIYKFKRNSQEIVYGGIDLWTGIVKNEKNILDESFNSQSTFYDEESYTDIISIKDNKINIDLSYCNTVEFPFLVKRNCSICNKELNVFELKINEKFKNMYKILNSQYCIDHNPFKCEKCNKIIIDEYITIDEENYHIGCLKCKYCDKKLSMDFCQFNDELIHKKCLENYKSDLREKQLRDFIKQRPNCEFCDEKITDKYYKCYICKKFIFGEAIKTNNGLSHKECLSFIKFIIYAFIDMMNNNY